MLCGTMPLYRHTEIAIIIIINIILNQRQRRTAKQRNKIKRHSLFGRIKCNNIQSLKRVNYI